MDITNKAFRVLPLSLAAILAFGTGPSWAQSASQTSTHQGPGGSMSMGKHRETGRPSRTTNRMSGKLKGEEFSSQMEAKAHCPSQTVVWVNTRGRAFHLPKSRFYGKTKHGAYACQAAAEKAGYHASKT